MALGQLTHLPGEVAANPFHRLLVRFSRYKAGSFESMFQIERWLVRYAWVGLIVLIALVWPPLEEIDFVSTVVRLLTLVYPLLFIWSLTRLAGVELMQLMLEGQWTADLLATPMGNRELTVGFVTPIWLTIRQYGLITMFSLVLYGLETEVIVYDDEAGYYLLDEFTRKTLCNAGVFFCGVSWIIFLYLARLYVEIRLRNGLLKGLMTLLLLLGGFVLLALFLVLFVFYPRHQTDTGVLAMLWSGGSLLLLMAFLLHVRLARCFRSYLAGQLGIDLLIYDEADPQATAWEKVS